MRRCVVLRRDCAQVPLLLCAKQQRHAAAAHGRLLAAFHLPAPPQPSRSILCQHAVSATQRSPTHPKTPPHLSATARAPQVVFKSILLQMVAQSRQVGPGVQPRVQPPPSVWFTRAYGYASGMERVLWRVYAR